MSSVLVVAGVSLPAALQGFAVVHAADGIEAVRAAGTRRADALVLGLHAPVLGAVEVCRRLRADGDRIPILVLAGHHTVADRVRALQAGADDVVALPVAPEELTARLHAALRRARPAPADPIRAYADVRLDHQARRAWRGDRELGLTPTELALLDCLLAEPGRVVPRERLRLRVWGCDLAESNSLGVYVGYLRRKLEAGGERRLIHTMRSVGYVLGDR